MKQFIKHFNLSNANQNASLYIAACNIPKHEEYSSNLSQYFSLDDMNEINQFTFQNKKHNFYLSRTSSKLAASQWNPTLSLKEIQISNGYFSQPYIRCNQIQNVSISITHCDDIAITASYPEEFLIGIDLEVISEQVLRVITPHLTQNELSLLTKSSFSQKYLATILWTAKEALSKTLRIGFTSELNLFEIASMTYHSNHYISQFHNFPQFQAYSLLIAPYVLTIVLPFKIEPLPSFDELVPLLMKLKTSE